MSTAHAPPFLRLAVVAAATALVLGVVALGVVVIRGDELVRTAPAHPAALRVVVRGKPDGLPLGVEGRWRDRAVELVEAARRGEEPGVWILEALPRDRPVTLVVLDKRASPPRRLVRRVLPSPYPLEVDVDVSASAREGP